MNSFFGWNMAMVLPFVWGVIAVILMVVIGFPIANAISRYVARLLAKRNVDVSLVKFAEQALRALLKVLVLLMAAPYVGIEVMSFVAILGAVGFAVGLAFQGSLANFAGGILLLVLRPFKVGDYIDAAGGSGTVDEIGIIYTKIITVDNKVIFIPNGSLANHNITNYSAKDIRRVDLTVSASYDADVEGVKRAIESVIERHERVLKEPDYFVRLGAHGASSLDYTVRVWVNASDYWAVHFDLLEQIKAQFDAEHIEIPYNKLDVQVTHPETH